MPSREFKELMDLLESRPEPAEIEVGAWREDLEKMARMFSLPEDVTVSPVDVGGMAGEWVAPPGNAEGVMLYFHGGGYALGSINTHRHLGALLAKASNSRVLLIDYRLAPENPFPAAVEDAVKAYRWLLKEDIKPESISIGGDSAGGGLTVSCLVEIRETELPLPACGVCLSPWVDLTCSGASLKQREDDDPVVKPVAAHQLSEWYLNGGDAMHPLASPLFADLRGLPPLLIHVGTAETLYDDSTRLATAAKDAGIEAELDVWEDMIHVWHFYAPLIPEGMKAIERVGGFVRARVNSAS